MKPFTASTEFSVDLGTPLANTEDAKPDLQQMNNLLLAAASARTYRLERQQSALNDLIRSDEVRLGTKHEAMRVLVRALGHEFGVDRCGFWLLNDARDAFALSEVLVTADGGFIVPEKWDTPERLRTMLRRSAKKILAIDDITKPNPLSRLAKDYFKPLGIASTLQAPIVSHGELIGFLSCATVNRCIEWTADQKLFTAAIANLAALVLERHERLDAQAATQALATRLARQQDALNQMLREEAAAAGADDLAQLYTRISKILNFEMGVDRVGVRFIAETGIDLVYTEVHSAQDSAQGFVPHRSLDQPYSPALSERIKTGPVVVQDCATDPIVSAVYKEIFEPRRIRALLHAPILIDGKLEGFVACSVYDRPKIWSAEDVLFASGAANIIALAIAKHRRLEAERRLEQANQAKSRFLTNMSHEIRTPLNGVLGMAELLQRTMLSEHQRKLLKTIQQSSKHLLVIVNDLLDVSRIEKGLLRLDTSDFELDSCIEEAVGILAGDARKKGISLDLIVDERLRGTVTGDAGRLRQVLLNLMGNAVKFTASAGVVSVRVSPVEGAPSMPLVRFEVCDTGIGIDPAAQPLLFLPFAQADSSINRRFGGTGLGLAICQQLVGLMGGQISLESEIGQGTRVIFTLPMDVRSRPEGVQESNAHPHVPQESAEQLRSNWSQRLHWNVLVAEDNPVNQIVAEDYLHSFDCTVTTVENGALAIAAFENEPFDVILMDCQMPEMDGLAATRRIREIERQQNLPPIPIIAVTAHAREEDRQDCIEAGMTGFLSKPYREEDLAKALQQWGPNLSVPRISTDA